MSQTSSRSGSSSQGRGGGIGGGYEGQGSPVPYHIGPLAYEPAVLCRCNGKACRWISWSNAQPGRRYYRCKKSRTGVDCGFFLWADEECSEWFKELLRDLRDAVWELKRELGKKDGELDAKGMVLEAKEMEVEVKKKEVEDMVMELNAKQQEVQAKEQVVALLEARLKNKNKCIDMLVVLCMFLLLTMVVILCNGNKA